MLYYWAMAFTHPLPWNVHFPNSITTSVEQKMGRWPEEGLDPKDSMPSQSIHLSQNQRFVFPLIVSNGKGIVLEENHLKEIWVLLCPHFCSANENPATCWMRWNNWLNFPNSLASGLHLKCAFQPSKSIRLNLQKMFGLLWVGAWKLWLQLWKCCRRCPLTDKVYALIRIVNAKAGTVNSK